MSTKKLYDTSQNKPLVILEIANNHMGDLGHGKELIRTFADAVSDYSDTFNFGMKFQFRELDTFIHPHHKGSDLKYVRRFEETVLSSDDWLELITLVKESGFALLATPFDEPSVEKCIRCDVDIIKIASCSLGDWPLIERVALAEKPVIFSTAGSDILSIDAMVAFFSNRGIPSSLMHCVGLYPTPGSDLNIGQVAFYKKRYPHIRVGYSTHEDPASTVTGGIAFALGAAVFEKHVGLPNDKYENNAYSTSPEQLCSWLRETKNSVVIVGKQDGKVKNSSGEVDSLRQLQRGVYARKALQAGQNITSDDVYFAIPSVENGVTANDFSKYTEFVLKADIAPDGQITAKNTVITDKRERIKAIVDKVRDFVNGHKIQIPNGVVLEISHHNGISDYEKTGMAMVTVVNEEYCKKLLFLLPGQSHPEQYHKKKKETFHILHGELELTLDDQVKVIGPGDVITINQMVRHHFFSRTGCVVEEISSSHETEDSFYTDKKIQLNKNRKTLVNFWV